MLGHYTTSPDAVRRANDILADDRRSNPAGVALDVQGRSLCHASASTSRRPGGRSTGAGQPPSPPGDQMSTRNAHSPGALADRAWLHYDEVGGTCEADDDRAGRA